MVAISHASGLTGFAHAQRTSHWDSPGSPHVKSEKVYCIIIPLCNEKDITRDSFSLIKFFRSENLSWLFQSWQLLSGWVYRMEKASREALYIEMTKKIPLKYSSITAVWLGQLLSLPNREIKGKVQSGHEMKNLQVTDIATYTRWLLQNSLV